MQKERINWGLLSFVIPFLAGGTGFAVAEIVREIKHPSANLVGDIICIIPLAYITLGICCGLSGIAMRALFKAMFAPAQDANKTTIGDRGRASGDSIRNLTTN